MPETSTLQRELSFLASCVQIVACVNWILGFMFRFNVLVVSRLPCLMALSGMVHLFLLLALPENERISEREKFYELAYYSCFTFATMLAGLANLRFRTEDGIVLFGTEDILFSTVLYWLSSLFWVLAALASSVFRVQGAQVIQICIAALMIVLPALQAAAYYGGFDSTLLLVILSWFVVSVLWLSIAIHDTFRLLQRYWAVGRASV